MDGQIDDPAAGWRGKACPQLEALTRHSTASQARKGVRGAMFAPAGAANVSGSPNEGCGIQI